MIEDKLAPYFFIAAGLAFIGLSFPRLRNQTLSRLQSQGYLPQLKLKAKDREIIAGAGPNLSLFILGFLLLAIGILELIYT